MQKKKYITPVIEFEEYSLDMSIASNCAAVVNNGPEMLGYSVCASYAALDPFGSSVSSNDPIDGRTVNTNGNKNVSFYEENCDCYTTGSNQGYWTS